MTDRWYLRRVGAFQHKRTILHLDVNEVTISRSSTATHCFQTKFLSRKHAVLRNVNGEWFLMDNGGMNGTFLNTDRIDPNKEYSLVENDIIGFGMPLVQQNEEESIVYRLCKDQVTKSSSTSSSRSGVTESQGSEKAFMMVPNNHLVIKNSVGASQLQKKINQDPDRTIVTPDCGIPRVEPCLPKLVSALPVLVIKKEITSPNETLPQITNCDFTIKPCDSAKQKPEDMKLQNDEIVCIDLEDSDDEASLPIKQAPEPPTTNSSCVLPCAKSCEAAIASAFVGDDVIDLSDDDDDRHHLDNSLKANDKTNYCDAQTHMLHVKSNDNAHTNGHDRQQVPESSRDEEVKKIESLETCDEVSGGMQQVRECASPKLFSECSVLNTTNKCSKTNEARPTDAGVVSVVQPPTNDLPGVLDETTKVPSEQASDSESELFDGIGYSQDDELILISDDETYISQKNCQAENNAAPFTIKHEDVEDVPPCELEENNDWNNMFHERLMKDIDTEYAAKTSESTDETPMTNAQTSKVSDPGGIPVQIDNNFTLAGPSMVSEKAAAGETSPLPGPSGISATASDKTGEDPMETSDFFPELSQNFYADEKPSDSEEDEMQTYQSSVDRNNVEPNKGSRCNRLSLNQKTGLTSPKKPMAPDSFYSLGSKGTYDRLKNKQTQHLPGGTVMTRAMPHFRGRRAVACNSTPLQKPKTTTYKRKSNATGKNSTAMKKGLLKDFIKDRVRMPGGGTDIRTGLRSPTKKPGCHVRADNDKLPKFPNDVIKSSSTGLTKPVGAVGCDAQRASSSNVPNGRNTSNDNSELLQGVAKERRPPTFRSRELKSRSQHLAEAMLESTTQPSKRKALPLPTAKLPPKKQAIERPVAALRNNKGKDLPKPSKAAILLPLPVSKIKHSVPVKAPNNSNKSELDTKNKKSNKRISFSENPPEVRYFQPDKVEEQIQHQDEIAFMAGPQRPEVIAASRRILNIILSWKSAWLHEQETIKHPPPVVNSTDIKDAISSYSSHAEYVKVYEPLLLLETWESISQDWRQRRNSCRVIQLILGVILQDTEETMSKSMFFHCYAVFNDVDEEKGRLPQDGWLSILEVPVSREDPGAKVDGAGRSYIRLFAYVVSCKKTTVNYLKKDEPISPLLKKMISKHKDKKIVMKLVLQTRHAILSVNEDRPLNLMMTAYLKPQLRIFQALHYLPFSFLGPGILKPDEEFCLLSSGRSLKSLVNIDNIQYNQIQRNIILKTTETVSSPNVSPKICLIQGPPGTGKSTLIIGLILQLLFGSQIKGKAKPRILLCAPSNGAIDEILHRLLELRKALTSSQKLRMIRVGFMDSIQARVKAYSLDSIVRSNIGNQKTMLEKEINNLTTALNVLRQKLDTQMLRNGKRSEINKTKMDIDLIESKLYAFKKKLDEWNHQSPDERQHNYCIWREECLKNADIIATTLGSCTQHGMEIFLRNNNHPFICIVDEATQSIEQETLLPLQFCVSKLILIGDPKQLPATVLSTKAKEKNLNQSLFERLFNYFGNSPVNPIVMLDVQYRMHPELCFYPSKAFYKSKLRTDSQIEQKYATSPTVPYLFFDIRDSKEESTGKGDLTNPNEAIFIVKLCEALLILVKERSFSLGVVAFYQHQRHLIKEKLAASATIQQLLKNESIEVNTVDGFQGREKDIIIVSSVRANSPNGSIGFINQPRRLNVAITRAKRSLFICGHRESLMVSQYWKGLIDDANFRKKVEKVASPITLTAIQNIVTRPFQ